jgi:hypothetical protein
VRNPTDKVEPQTYHLLMVAAHRPACFEDIDRVLACLQSLVEQMIALRSRKQRWRLLASNAG